MIGYMKPLDGDVWQELGRVEGQSISVEDPTQHYETDVPHSASISITIPAKTLDKKLLKFMSRKYPRLPRKMKKRVKSFRKMLGMSCKKCSREELIRTCCLLWDCAPGHEGVDSPAWINRAGWKIRRGGEKCP